MLQHGVDNKDTSVIVTGIERMYVCVYTLRPWAPLRSTCRGGPNEGRMCGVLAPTSKYRENKGTKRTEHADS